MSKTSVPYVLRRVYPDGTEQTISEHPDFASGWSVGTHTVTVLDKEGAYSLYENGRRVAKFGHARLMVKRDAEDLLSVSLYSEEVK